MIRILKYLLLLWLAVCPPDLVATEPDVQDDNAIVTLLRGGGYILYFRHAQTDWAQTDKITRKEDWTSCDPKQVRQLSAEGRRTATAVGQAIRALELPVGRVLSSPYCRTVETARLMGLGPVTTTDDVMNLRVADYFGGTRAIVARARALLSTRPENATNWVVVAHGNVARAATPVYPGEAEGVVFLPHGDGLFSLIGRLTPAQWEMLAE